MQINTLTLNNFRSFKHTKISFHPQLTVLAGVNGSGKSSVLEGLAVSIGAWFLGFDSVNPRNIRTEEVRVAQFEVGGQPSIEQQFPCQVSASGCVSNKSIKWTRSILRQGGRTTYGHADAIKSSARSVQKQVSQGQPVDLPVIAFYGTGRLWVQKRENANKLGRLGSRTQAYEDCLDPASNQKLFESWMRRLEAAQIQRIAEHVHKGPMPDDVFRPPALDAVQRVAACMVDGAERLYFDVAYNELRLLFQDGRRLPFHLLSDGYRNIVALAADIAWRAVQLNPHQLSDAPTLATGIVLIDEVELHLHPSWQREVLGRLTSTFPNLQFIVTTHAPLVIASTPATQLRFLNATGEVYPVGVAKGLSANVVLRELMGVPERPDQTTSQLARLGALIEQGDKESARHLFNELKTQLGNLDPDLLTLEWELRDLEVHGAVD